MRRIGALEAGGTKMVLAVYQDGNEIDRISFTTSIPKSTIPQIVEYFKAHDIESLGVGSFGPLDLINGIITTTPKQSWQNYPLRETLEKALGCPCAIDTDVNTAVLAETRIGAARGLSDVVYVTIGTGIGGGVMSNNSLVHGMLHPEIGHMLIQPHPDDPNPHGVCPYHNGCLEGLASGTAITARVQCDARTLPDHHPTFLIEADYLAQMCMNLILTISPQRILLGGGVMQRDILLPKIRELTQTKLNGYLQAHEIIKGIDKYIVAPALYPYSGLVGAYMIGDTANSARLSSSAT